MKTLCAEWKKKYVNHASYLLLYASICIFLCTHVHPYRYMCKYTNMCIYICVHTHKHNWRNANQSHSRLSHRYQNSYHYKEKQNLTCIQLWKQCNTVARFVKQYSNLENMEITHKEKQYCHMT